MIYRKWLENLKKWRKEGSEGMKIKSTTVIGYKKNGEVVLGSDGQVTLGNTVMKQSARKVRKIFDNKVLVVLAGATADAFSLLEKFEQKLNRYNGHILKASVELAKEWKTDKVLRNLEALLVVMDKDTGLIISGNGDVIEPDDGVLAIGSGAPYALAAARALIRHADKSAEEIVKESLKIASEICIYTNDNITIEKL